ncbi:MAG TPA: hypothetical protein VGG79_02835 [Roseiarcus sp.]|jgi:hypothetical protein
MLKTGFLLRRPNDIRQRRDRIGKHAIRAESHASQGLERAKLGAMKDV